MLSDTGSHFSSTSMELTVFWDPHRQYLNPYFTWFYPKPTEVTKGVKKLLTLQVQKQLDISKGVILLALMVRLYLVAHSYASLILLSFFLQNDLRKITVIIMALRY